MNIKLKIYRDIGADIRELADFDDYLTYYQLPYDSKHRPNKKRPELAIPSEARWSEGNIEWGETKFTFEEFSGSEIYSEISAIIGLSSNRWDILHVDSAYKTGCQIFITSDKRDIWSKRSLLEPLCNMKIFHVSSELETLRKYIIQTIQY